MFMEVSMGHLDLNLKRHDIVEPDVLVLSKKFLNSKILNVFKEFSSAHQACIYLKIF